MIDSPKRASGDFAALGGPPLFEHEIPVGQINLASWDRFEAAMRGIFERQWYTNHGPLAQQIERELSEFLGVAHVICVTNATVGLMMAVKALGWRRGVVLPAFTFPATAQAVVWAGASARFCDVDPDSQQVTSETVESVLDDEVDGILAVNAWGDVCDIAGVAELAAERNVGLVFDSAQAFGCDFQGRRVGGFGAMEVFSFHATKILNAAEGGCVCTQDEELAARLRNIRSSYGSGRPVAVPVTANGRFSEAQAALAMLSLEDYESNRERNQDLLSVYEEGLREIPGVTLRLPPELSASNCQYAVIQVEAEEFGLSRNGLLDLLKAERVNARRYFYPGLHRMPPFAPADRPLPQTDHLCETVLQLPLGALVSRSAAIQICDLLRAAQRIGPELSRRLAA